MLTLFTQLPHRGLSRTAAVALLLACLVLGRPAGADGTLPAEVTLPWTPVCALLPDYCGPASLTSVLRYWGRPADQAAIGRAVFDRP